MTQDVQQDPSKGRILSRFHTACPPDGVDNLTAPGIGSDYDGSIAILRSFQYDIARRIEQLRKRFQVSVLGTVTYGPHHYPLYQIAAINDPSKPYVRLAGIVHGDEEAGGKAILEFFEKHISRFANDFNFIANPCVNPSGYETATLQAMNGYHPSMRTDKNTGNINRSFGGALDQQEARILEQELAREGRRYLFAIDMHESPPYYTDETYSPADAPRGCWLYETCSDDSLRLGTHLTDTLPSHLEVCDWPIIYSDKAERGVIAFSAQSTGHAELSVPTSLEGH